MLTSHLVKERERTFTFTELADAHCHLDLISDRELINAAVRGGVRTIVTDGVDTKSNALCAQMVDGKNIYAAMGIDPEHSGIDDEELDFNIKMIKANPAKICAIGEIGLDYAKGRVNVGIERQKKVFGAFLDLAVELDKPVTIHSREAMEDVLAMLEERGVKGAHMHFFEGGPTEAKIVEKLGYMISVPPFESSRRNKAIEAIAIDNIMAESDSPAAGATPLDVGKSVGIVAKAKGISFERAAEQLTANTKRFFNVGIKSMMR
ncbi:MAG TPA: TatD family hydrolase [Candidatus Acidoferrales bacterium]|nr:TatD family hydrolase [Candidatus Acidoferrales bacterium]